MNRFYMFGALFGGIVMYAVTGQLLRAIVVVVMTLVVGLIFSNPRDEENPQ